MKDNLQTINDVLLDTKLFLIGFESSFKNDSQITDADIDLLCKDTIYI